MPASSDREESPSLSRNDGAASSNPENNSNLQNNPTINSDQVVGKNTSSDDRSEQTLQQDESMLTQFAEPVSETPAQQNTLAQQNVVEQETKSPRTSTELQKGLVQVFKLLADETRLKILFLLGREKELHVSALCERLGQSQPAVSHHLALLRVAGLIEPRRDGKHNFYSIQQNRFHGIIGELFTTFADDENSSEFRFENFVFRQDGTDA